MKSIKQLFCRHQWTPIRIESPLEKYKWICTRCGLLDSQEEKEYMLYLVKKDTELYGFFTDADAQKYTKEEGGLVVGKTPIRKKD